MATEHTDEAANFLRQWNDGKGFVSITAIEPDGPIMTRCFDEEAELRRFIDQHHGKSNLYFAVNPLRAPRNKKATKKDVAALAWLHVDIDPRDGSDFQEERQRIKATLEAFSPLPTVIIDSGGGFQAFWRLHTPVLANGNISGLEAYNKGLEAHFDADHCHNIDRIMRLPGTVNLPNKKKRAKGRQPAPAKVLRFGDETYDLSDFESLKSTPAKTPAEPVALPDDLPKVDVPSLPIRKRIKHVIRHGEDLNKPAKYPSRSEALFAVLMALVGADCDDTTIAAVCLDPSNAISEKPLEQKDPSGWLAKEIYRAREKTRDVGPYTLRNGAVHQKKVTNHGVTYIPLCNFNARIVEDLLRDDGAETVRFYAIEGEQENGRPLRRVEIPAAKFLGLKWLHDAWGASAVVMPGHTIKDHLATAIQMMGGEVTRRTVYAHLGWRKIEGKWLYLHGEGALGPDGPVQGVEVDAGETLDGYVLPPVADARLAVRASLKLLELGSPEICYPLLAAIYRAPLSEFAPVTFSLFFAGGSGVFKSAVTAIAQAHYGPKWNWDHMPGNWSSTANALEREAFQVKDSLFTVDDFAPSGSRYEVQRLHGTAERLLRGQGNRSGRHRMNADATLKPTLYPRGLIISSGEDIPAGKSLRARMVIIEVGEGEIDRDMLTEMQGNATEGILAESMAGYIQWLAGRVEQLRKELPARQQELRAKAMGPHARTPDNMASLLVGLEQFLGYAVEVGAINETQAKDHREEALDALGKQGASQAVFIASEDPVERFIALIQSAVASGRAHLANKKDGGVPGSPQPCGWFEVRGGEWRPQGDRIGWVDNDGVYLDPTAAYACAQKYARDGGESLPLTKQSLWKRLAEGGLILSKGKDRNTMEIMIAGQRHKVLHLSTKTILGVENVDDESPF